MRHLADFVKFAHVSRWFPELFHPQNWLAQMVVSFLGEFPFRNSLVVRNVDLKSCAQQEMKQLSWCFFCSSVVQLAMLIWNAMRQALRQGLDFVATYHIFHLMATGLAEGAIRGYGCRGVRTIQWQVCRRLERGRERERGSEKKQWKKKQRTGKDTKINEKHRKRETQKERKKEEDKEKIIESKE